MEIVLDSVSLQHLLRNLEPREGSGGYETALDRPMRNGGLILVLDNVGGLEGEWVKTCGKEIVGVVLSKWEELKGVSFIPAPPAIHPHITKQLRILGFTDTIDKLILRLATTTADHVVVSDDNDFWDPKSTTERGNRNAPVTKLCREQLGITITLLRPLLRELP